MGTYNRGSLPRARTLRTSQTDAEYRLWNVLRNRQLGGHKFVRQLPVGPYFADFACRERDLIVELDGSQHLESVRDAQRTKVLAEHGYAVLRFWNDEVFKNLDGVVQVIEAHLARAPSPGLRFAKPDLSPEGRGDAGVPSGLDLEPTVSTITSPYGGEVAAQRRLRGPSSPPGDQH